MGSGGGEGAQSARDKQEVHCFSVREAVRVIRSTWRRSDGSLCFLILNKVSDIVCPSLTFLLFITASILTSVRSLWRGHYSLFTEWASPTLWLLGWLLRSLLRWLGSRVSVGSWVMGWSSSPTHRCTTANERTRGRLAPRTRTHTHTMWFHMFVGT